MNNVVNLHHGKERVLAHMRLKAQRAEPVKPSKFDNPRLLDALINGTLPVIPDPGA